MAEPSAPPPEPANLKERLKASYDAIAPAYNAWTVSHTPTRLAYLDRLRPLLRPDGAPRDRPLRIVELGCGAGPVTSRLLRHLAPAHLTANDLSPVQIDLARAAVRAEGIDTSEGADTPVDWVEGDMMALRFDDGSVDAVVAFYSILHLPRAEQSELIARIARWLRPATGCLLANFAADAMPAVVMDGWLQDDGWAFWSGWGMDANAAQLRDAGLELLASEVVPSSPDDGMFHWVLARRREDGAGRENSRDAV